MNSARNSRLVVFAVSVLCFSDVARANSGVPMLFVTLPAMLIALIPIILVEASVLARRLDTSAASLLKSAAIANVTSTVVGLPLAWVALVALQLVSGGGSSRGLDTPAMKLLAVTWQSPWLIPYERDLYWMLPAASLVLLVPFFFTSYLVEAPIVTRLEGTYPRAKVRVAVLSANIRSYMLLAVFCVGWLVWAVLRGP